MSREDIEVYRARGAAERRRAEVIVHPRHRELALNLAAQYDQVAAAYERLAKVTGET